MSEIYRSSVLGRIVGAQGDHLQVEFQTGATMSFELVDEGDHQIGDVVFVDQESRLIDEAPAEYWQEELWIARVLAVSSEQVLVSLNERALAFPVPDFGVIEGDVVIGRGRRITAVADDAIANALPEGTKSEIVGPVIEPVDPKVFGDLGFGDFRGMPEVVNRAKRLVDVSLNHREAITKIGARPVKGVLFSGPPGTGKTLLARILAVEAQASFFSISGPEFLNKWYGESELVLRQTFEAAAAKARSIIFFDEIDSVGASREDDSHEASRRVVTQLLTKMDGLERDRNVIVIATTNRVDILDRALRRPGRFDWEIEFRHPTEAERIDILRGHAGRMALAEEPPLERIAKMTDGWSGAELELIWTEAAFAAAPDGRTALTSRDVKVGFVEARRTRTVRNRSQPRK